MPSARSNYRVTTVTELASNIIQQSHLQSNILQASHIEWGGLRSLIIFDSYGFNTGLGSVGPYTISMGGYGAPSFMFIIGMSTATDCASIPMQALGTQSFSGSIGWIYFFLSDGAPPATHTTRILYAALIGSR